MGTAWVYVYGGYFYVAGAIKHDWPFVKILVATVYTTSCIIHNKVVKDSLQCTLITILNSIDPI